MNTEKIPTPRTDAAELDLIRNQPGLDEKRVMSAFDFARQLERELAEAKATIFDLRDTTHLCQQISEAMARISKLEKDRALHRSVIGHSFLHSNYNDCGFLQMTTGQKVLLCEIIKEEGMEESAVRLGMAIDAQC